MHDSAHGLLLALDLENPACDRRAPEKPTTQHAFAAGLMPGLGKAWSAED